jgi:hypothetical protein
MVRFKAVWVYACFEWHHRAVHQVPTVPAKLVWQRKYPSPLFPAKISWLTIYIFASSSLHFPGFFLFGNPFGFIIVFAPCPNNPLFLHHSLYRVSLRTYHHRPLIATPMEEGTVPTASEPPPLPYSLHTRKKSIALFWTIFVIDTLAQPLILYWCLWYLTDLSHNVGMFCMV